MGRLERLLQDDAPTLHGRVRHWQEVARRVGGIVAVAFERRRDGLAHRLGYPLPEAEQLLASAVACYLDERCHVTNRERLGF